MTRGVTATMWCNLACDYCYETMHREVTPAKVAASYDLEAVLNALEEWHDRWPDETPPGVHGGEPLLIPLQDLRKIFAFIERTWDNGHPWIQTNGTLITDEHIETFKKYNVGVGVSCDGPDDLNENRVPKDGDAQGHTQSTLDALTRLQDAGVNPGVIVVLNSANAADDERLTRLLDWIDELMKRGITGHFNPAGETPCTDSSAFITPERLRDIYLHVWEWLKEEPYREWGPHNKLAEVLRGREYPQCHFGSCNPLATSAAKTITGDGNFSSCGRTWSDVGDGTQFLVSPDDFDKGNPRDDVLRNVPQSMDGCKDCRWWSVCHGGCPGAGKNGDWRNRTVWCIAHKALYERIEKDIRATDKHVTLRIEEN